MCPTIQAPPPVKIRTGNFSLIVPHLDLSFVLFRREFGIYISKFCLIFGPYGIDLCMLWLKTYHQPILMTAGKRKRIKKTRRTPIQQNTKKLIDQRTKRPQGPSCCGLRRSDVQHFIINAVPTHQRKLFARKVIAIV